MGEILGADIQCTIPDNLTLPQFILDSSHPARRIRKDGTPWLVDDSTGHRMGLEEVSRERTTRPRRFEDVRLDY